MQQHTDEKLYYLDEFSINEDKYRNVKFEEAMEYTGFGKYNYLLILVCGVTLYGVNGEAYSIGYILPAAECDLNLNTYTKGILSSTSFIGFTGSCWLWGYLSDTRGRRKLLIVSLALAFISSVVAALVPSFWGFAILRLFNGIFISGPAAIVFTYFGEFQSRIYRSRAMAFMSLSIAIAIFALPGFGWILLPQRIKWEFLGMQVNSWRLFMLIQAIPSIVAAVSFTQLYETPEYLYHSGDIEGALRVMKKMYSINTGKLEESFPVKTLQDKIVLNSRSRRNIFVDLWNQIAPLFTAPHLKYTLSACVMQGGTWAVSSGLYLWYPDIINQLSNSASIDANNMTVCNALSFSQAKLEKIGTCNEKIDDEVFIQNLIIGATYIFGYTAWGFVVKFLGNRNFFVLCMVISAGALILLNIITQKLVIDTLFVFLLTLPGICVTVITSSIVDIIPTYLCGMAVCITLTAGRLGSIASSSVVGIMLQWNCTTTFALYAISLIVCVILAFIFPKHPTAERR